MDILDAIADPIFVKDRSFRWVTVNEACCRAIGRRPHEIVGKTDYELFAKEQADAFRAQDEAVLAGGAPVETLDRLPDPSGERAFSTKKTLYRDPAGREFIVGITRDVTDQMRVEREHRMNLSFLDQVIENIPNMIFVKDAKELRFVRFNRAGEELLGISREQMYGKNDHDFFPRAEADFFNTKDREVLSGRKPVDIPEEPIQTRAHGERILHTRKVPILGENGEPLYLLGISEDVTERHHAEEMQRQKAMLEEKARFLSVVSHELRTPLQSIREGISVVLDQVLGPISGDQRESLTIARRNVDRFARLINSVLDMQRLEVHLVHLTEPYPFDDAVAEAVKTMLPLAHKKGLALETRLGAGSRKIRYDRDRVLQVLLNLLSNAIKFTDQGSVSVVTDGEGSDVTVTVSDTGPGIAAGEMNKIFDAFVQLHPGDRSLNTGLGLTITKRIVELCGGRIAAGSRPGDGTRFIVHLPAETAR